MPDLTVTKHHLSLPWASVIATVVGVASGSGVYYTMKGDVHAAREVGAGAHEYAERIEAATVARFVIAERRIEKLEETGNRTLLLLERIDERTGEMKRRMDAIPAR